MNNPPEKQSSEISHDDVMAGLFANMVIQNTNMAFMFLGRMPHPETGQTAVDLEAARFFIDQMEMIAVKTKGNLSKQEEGLLKQSLTSLRMAYVDAADAAPGKESAPEPTRTGEPAKSDTPAADEKPNTATDDDSRKKFTKKY